MPPSAKNKTGICDFNWEDTSAEDIEAYIDCCTHIYENSGSANIKIFLWQHLCVHYFKTGYDTKMVLENWAIHTPQQ
jgi:hypothetical protein